jgi:hypothetical protein
MSESGFAAGQLPADVLQNPHSKTSSTTGSEDSMDKSDDDDEEEDVRMTPERRKEGQPTERQQQPQAEKKRNPYSIEELLKKPDNAKKCSPTPPATVSLQTMLMQPPCGLLVDKPCTCSLVAAVRPHQDHEVSGIDLTEASSSSSCASSLRIPAAISQRENLHKQAATCNT